MCVLSKEGNPDSVQQQEMMEKYKNKQIYLILSSISPACMLLQFIDLIAWM